VRAWSLAVVAGVNIFGNAVVRMEEPRGSAVVCHSSTVNPGNPAQVGWHKDVSVGPKKQRLAAAQERKPEVGVIRASVSHPSSSETTLRTEFIPPRR
jgi:hypothetical protein